MPKQEEAIFFKLGNDSARMPAGKTVIEYKLDELRTPDGTKTLAKNIFLRVRGPEKICIVGINGVGKTTLLKLMAEELLSRKDIKAQYMPQNYEELLDFDVTPVEFLDDTGDKSIRTQIRTYLGSLKYTADEMEKEETLIFAVVDDKERFVGSVEMHGLSEDCPELGAWITESKWGKGYAFEALNFIF